MIPYEVLGKAKVIHGLEMRRAVSLDQEVRKELSGVMEMFYILIDCGNGCINTFVKIHRIVL
jgi:hypothetical protein